MCGIVAIYSRFQAVDGQKVMRATLELNHRGPDAQRIWVSDDQRVGLGHARLSIIDLTTGDQPISNEDGRLHVVINGELYGYEQIQKSLEQAGHVFRTKSDSEIVLHLYEEYGFEMFEHLRGEFAGVLWDEREQRIIAFRDRFGIKPIYYAMHDSTLYIASEMKAIFAAGVPAEWDKESYYQHLMFCKSQDRTLFKGVYQIPPAQYMVASQDGITLRPYWDHDYPLVTDALPQRSEQEYVEELQRLLDESVRIRLRADVPVGCYLSGGIDSSLVLGMAAKHAPDTVDAFTVRFDHEDFDEGDVAQETAAFTGARFNPIAVSKDDLAEHLVASIWHAETIGINANGVARYLQSKAVREAGFKTVLSGDGADEIFAGYIFSVLDQLLEDIKELDNESKVKVFENIAAKTPGVSVELLMSFLTKANPHLKDMLGYTPGFMHAMDLSRGAFKGLLAPDFAQEMGGRDAHKLFLEGLNLQGQLAGRHPVQQSLYLWNKSILPNQIFFSDRMDMGNSVEVRMPLMDHKLLEFTRQMPVSLLIRNHQEKYVFRQAAKPYVTERVYNRQKKPFQAPHTVLESNKGIGVMIQDKLRSQSMADVPFFDQKQVIQLLDNLPKTELRQQMALDAVLLLLLTTVVMHEQFVRDRTSLRS